MTGQWVDVCSADDIDEEDVIQVEIEDLTIAVYNTPDGYYATDGICTHEYALLADGLVMDGIIECPLHQGRFRISSGEALSAPACENLKTYTTKIDNGRVLIDISS